MKYREPKEFLHDMAYQKHEIWEDCEILKTFGHDPATYPDQDLYQHYAEVQFNPAQKCDCDEIKPEAKPDCKSEAKPDCKPETEKTPVCYDGTICEAAQVEETAVDAINNALGKIALK